MNRYYGYIVYYSSGKIKEFGVVDHWDICKQRVKGFKSSYRKFDTHTLAFEFIQDLIIEKDKISNSVDDQILYFDSGTGFKEGVEVRVVDQNKQSCLDKIIPLKYLNQRGNYLLPIKEATNNYGELLACYFALKLALQLKYKVIYGDSNLVLNYWSKDLISKQNNQVTKRLTILAKKTAQLRHQFEEQNGKILFIQGDKNWADLGFHR